MPPYTGNIVTRTDIKQLLANMHLVLKEARLEILFSAANRPLSVFMSDLLFSNMWSFHFRDWWIFKPNNLSFSTGLIIDVPVLMKTSFLESLYRCVPITNSLVFSSLTSWDCVRVTAQVGLGFV